MFDKGKIAKPRTSKILLDHKAKCNIKIGDSLCEEWFNV